MSLEFHTIPCNRIIIDHPHIVYGDGSKAWYLLFTPKNSWDLWMWITHYSNVSIGIDPSPYNHCIFYAIPVIFLFTDIYKQKSPKPRQKQTRCMPSNSQSRVHLTASALSFGCLEDGLERCPRPNDIPQQLHQLKDFAYPMVISTAEQSRCIQICY